MEFVFDQVETTTCSRCGGSVDVAGKTVFSQVECPHCQGKTRVPAKLGTLVLQEVLGTGAAGVVYKALDTTLQRQVAVKILRNDSGDARKAAEATLAEARALAAINHPHVVHVHTIGIRHNQPFIVMELLMGGGKLHVMLKEGWVADEQRGLQVAIDVAEGLNAALASGLLHRDVKPANILFNNEGSAKVLDFSAVSAPTSTDENKRIVVGTPYYIAPEAARGVEVDFRADIYSLGATLFHLLTGKPVFDGASSTEVMRARLKQRAPDVRTVNPNITPGTAAVIAHMLETNADDRPQSYEDLIANLRAALNDLVTGHIGGEGSLAGLHAAVAQREVVPATLPRRPRVTEAQPAPRKGLAPWVYGVAAAAVLLVIGLIALIAGGGGGGNEVDPNQVAANGQSGEGGDTVDQPKMGMMPRRDVPPPPTDLEPAKDSGKTAEPPVDPPKKADPPKQDPPKKNTPPKKADPPKKTEPPKNGNPFAPPGPPPGPREEGFRVVTVRPASGGITSLDEAEQLFEGKRPGRDVTIDEFPVLNFADPEAPAKRSGGYFEGDRAFPGDSKEDDDHFALRATGRIFIPATGKWTFVARCDDSVRIKIEGRTLTPLDKPGSIHDSAHGVTMGNVGYYNIEVLYFEASGDAELELFAARGEHRQFDKNSFKLVGDTVNGGLYVYQPTKPDGVELAKATPVTPPVPPEPTGPPPPKLDAYVPAEPKSFTEWRLYDAVPREGFVVVPRFAEWHIWAKAEPVHPNWNARKFGAAGWEMATGSLGYGAASLKTVLSDMKGKFRSVYIRAPFKVDDPSELGELSLAARYNDAMAVYINGKEVFRSSNLEGAGDKAKVKEVSRAAAQPMAIELKDANKYLVKGENIIAIECHAYNADDPSFVLDPFLFAEEGSGGKPSVATNKKLNAAQGWTMREADVTQTKNGLDFKGTGNSPRMEHGRFAIDEGLRRDQVYLVVFAKTNATGRANLDYVARVGNTNKGVRGEDAVNLVPGRWNAYVFLIRLNDGGDINQMALSTIAKNQDIDIRWIRLQSDNRVEKNAGKNVLKEWQFAQEP